MILVDGEKYACVQCIRGHRSSTCKHSYRPLVQVRSRGRPALNQTHRIAVTQTELLLSRDQVTFQSDIDSNPKNVNSTQRKQPAKAKSCCSGQKKYQPPTITTTTPLTSSSTTQSSCCKNKSIPKVRSCCNHTSTKTESNCPSCKSGNNSVILLRASQKQFVEVKNGNLDFVAPYVDSGFKVLNNGATSELFTPNSTIDNIESISNSNNNNDNNNNSKRSFGQANVSQLQVFKKVKVNRVDSTPKLPSQIPVLLHQPCSLPLINHQIPNNYPSSALTPEHTNYELPTSQELDRILSQYTSRPSSPYEQVFDMALAAGCADECHCGPECSCPGCLIHRTNEELKAYGLLDNSPTSSSTPSRTDVNEVSNKEEIHFVNIDIPGKNDSINALTNEANDSNPLNFENLINFRTIDELFNEDFFKGADGCFCKDDECECFDCDRHNIKAGIKTLPNGQKISLVTPSYQNSINGIRTNLHSSSIYPTQTPKEAEELSLQYDDHDCGCPEDECECYNCTKHGNYNGIKVKKE